MKKITILAAALLGSVYFANAQVGIGTPTPNVSAMLDITATDKGVLIPRVALTDASTPLAGATTHENSLLVYNTNTASLGIEGKEVTPGFYYWNVNKWERIVNQSQLDTAITNVTNLQGDVTKIKALLDAAYGSNNLGETPTTGAFGGMVFTPTDGNTPAKVEYVTFNGTEYVKQDLSGILADIIDPANGSVFYNNIGTETDPVFVFQYWDASLNNGEGDFTTITISEIVQANETKTKIQTIEGKQFYFAENFEGDIPTNIPDELPAGMYLIDVVGGVVNNIEEIFTKNTQIVINEGSNELTFNTVQEYIEYIISENSDNNLLGTMIYNPGTGLTNASFTYILADGTVSTTSVTFSDIVKANQSLTDIQKITPSANVINYVYNAEPTVDGTERTFTIDLTADLIQQITNNTDIQTLIKNISKGNGGVHYNGTTDSLTVGNTNIPAGSFYTIDASGNGVLIDLGETVVNEVIENFNEIVDSSVTVNEIEYNSVEEYIQYIAETSDANVGFTTTEITAANNPEGLAIPENSFYYINDAGVKVEIPLNNIVYQGITQLTETQVTDVKTKLGDNFNTTNVVKTGDTWVDGKAIFKSVLETTVLAGTANITGATTTTAGFVTIVGDVSDINVIGIRIIGENGVSASATDLSVDGKDIYFRIGTGSMYNVLSANDLTVKVLVEFSANTTTP